jgi:metallophosphoesterase superfamily enzyme
MSDGPVLVVSDTHLGFQSPSAERIDLCLSQEIEKTNCEA